MKILLRILIIAFLLSSCNETEPVIFDPATGQTFVSFGANSSDLAVIIDDTGSVEVTVNVTTASASDRTFGLTVDTENSTANAENYTVPSSVTIPANAYNGSFTITGVDNSVEVDRELILINLVSGSPDELVSEDPHTVSIFQVCPVPATYMVGDYLLTDNGNGNFGTDIPVTIMIPEDNENQRTFVAEYLPGTGVARDVEASIDLLCNTFIFNTIDINVTCDVDDPNTSYIIGSAGDNSSSYDLTDDSVLVINYLEDFDADCGDTLVQNIVLTKI